MQRFQNLTRLFALLLIVAGCDPVNRCDKDQFPTTGQCTPCPEGSKPMGQTCVCDNPDATYEGEQCVLPDAGSFNGPETPEEACMLHCAFVKECLGDNALVQTAAADVVVLAGVDGSDVSKCESDCLASASAAEDEAALDCITIAASAATCQGDQTLPGAEQALAIIDMCCADQAGATLCDNLCTAIQTSPIALDAVPACQ